jgi:hypothetical protein
MPNSALFMSSSSFTGTLRAAMSLYMMYAVANGTQSVHRRNQGHQTRTYCRENKHSIRRDRMKLAVQRSYTRKASKTVCLWLRWHSTAISGWAQYLRAGSTIFRALHPAKDALRSQFAFSMPCLARGLTFPTTRAKVKPLVLTQFFAHFS